MKASQLEFEIIPQINEYFCSAASMQGIIYFLLGERIEQEKIFEIGHTAENNLKSYVIQGRKQKEEGLGSTGIISISKEFGLEGFITKKGSFDRLQFFIKKSLPILVNYQDDFENPKDSGHYGVITGFEENYIFLANPRIILEESILRINYFNFEKVWYDPSPSSGRWMASFWLPNKELEIPYKGIRIKSP